MSTPIAVEAASRTLQTKGALTKLRQSGTIPGVVYGKGEPLPIAVSLKAFPKEHTRGRLVTLVLESGNRTALMREVQVDPLTDIPLHVDFQEVALDDTVEVRVPLDFQGLTKEQEKEGSFKTLLRALTVRGPAAKLPTTLPLQVGQLKLGESLHVTDVVVPEGVSIVSKRNLALASLAK